jgi:hypothetical protein
LRELVPTTFFGRRMGEWVVLSRWRKKESRLDGGNNFERMEVNRDMLEV